MPASKLFCVGFVLFCFLPFLLSSSCFSFVYTPHGECPGSLIIVLHGVAEDGP